MKRSDTYLLLLSALYLIVGLQRLELAGIAFLVYIAALALPLFWRPLGQLLNLRPFGRSEW